MVKSLSVFAVLAILGAGSVHAQQNDPAWQKVDVPGADFSIVFAISKSSRPASDLRASPDPLVVYPAGSELAFAVDGEVEHMFKDIGAVQFPACAFRVERKGGKPIAAIAYVIPTDETPVAAKGE